MIDAEHVPPRLCTLPCAFVVDEDESVRRIIAIALEASGYLVIRFANVPAAIHALGIVGPPAVVVADTKTRGPSVMTLIEALRAAGGDCRILLVSAGLPDPQTLTAIQSGELQCLAKPFNGAELMARLRL